MQDPVKKAAASGLAAALLAAAPAMAAAPYYFVDHVSNKLPLFTDSACTGAYVNGCGKFTNACGQQYWSGDATFEEGVYMLKNGEQIHIRRNASPYDVVCTVSP